MGDLFGLWDWRRRYALGALAFAVHNGLSLKNLRFDYA
jgi:hypothetical protein